MNHSWRYQNDLAYARRFFHPAVISQMDPATLADVTRRHRADSSTIRKSRRDRSPGWIMAAQFRP